MTSPLSVALVTGAGHGIGAAISRKFAENGLIVAMLDIDEAATKKLEKIILSSGGQALTVPCDVSNKGSVESALSLVESKLGSISILVNNAGVGGPFHRIDEVNDEEWDWIINTNLRSLFFFCRALLPKMKASGFGRIVNLASVQGLVGAARSSTYVASKHAMVGYTKAIAAEWGEFGITCNALCPGYVDTRLGVQDSQVSNHFAKVLAKSPVKRIASPSEVATWAHHLIGPDSGYLNGSIIVLDGGMSSHLGID